MIAEYSFPDFKWVDVQQPNPKELSILQEHYEIGSDILQDLTEPISDTRLTTYKDQLYFTFHITSTFSLGKKPNWLELDIIIIDNTIITVTYTELPALSAIRKELEIEQTLKHQTTINLEQFLAGLFTKIHRDMRSILAAISSHQHKIDDNIFSGHERQMVRTISETGRLLFSLNQSIAEQRHLVKFFPTDRYPNLLSYWRQEVEHTADQTKAQYELYHDLRRTNEELLSTKQSEAMRKLTLIAFVTSPVTIMAGIFGMNTKNIPFIGSQYDFWIALGIMTGVVIVTVLLLYRKKWFE